MADGCSTPATTRISAFPPGGSTGSDDNDLEPTALVGSFRSVRLPQDFETLFTGDVLVDPRNGTPMEMDGYSSYLALTAIEHRTGRDQRARKLRLVEAVLRRLDETQPPFWHGGWVRHPEEVHLRFTAAAVRLLGEATQHGLLGDGDALSRALRYQLTFSDELSRGRWFLHDSFETPGGSAAFPFRRTCVPTWGASDGNNLVLNTHIDTLSTILAVAPLLPEDQRAWLTGVLDSGLRALDLVLRAPLPPRWFRVLDTTVRRSVFTSADWRVRGSYRLRSTFVRRYFRWRARRRARFPTFMMGDGYLERDIRLEGTAFQYHLVNISDLARLVGQLRDLGRPPDHDLVARCNVLVVEGIGYAVGSSYRREMIQSTNYSARAVLLCETMILTLANLNMAEMPSSWLAIYCALRRLVPRSPALSGYDPFVVRPLLSNAPLVSAQDTIALRDGRRLTIDIENVSCVWH